MMFKSKKTSKHLPEGTVIGGAAKSKSHVRFSRNQVAIVVIFLLAVSGAGAFFLSTRFSGPAASKIPCSEDNSLIEQYNTIVRKEGVTKLQPVVEKVRKKKSVNEPTCLYMLMMAQYGDISTTEEQNTYRQLKQLESRGGRVSEKISDGIDREAVEKIIKLQAEESNKGYDGQG